MKTLRLGFSSGRIALACVVLGGWASQAVATDIIEPSYPAPPCNYGPDATMTVEASPDGGADSGSRTSEGASYAYDCNSSYTVDVTLWGGYSHSAGNAIKIGGDFGPGTNLTEDNCSDAEVRLVIWRRGRSFLNPTWSSWTLVSYQDVSGTWVPFVDMGIQPYCQLASPLRVVAPRVGAAAQYRVQVLPKLDAIPRVAFVAWHWSL